jgi:hypothetical protein
VDGEEAGDRLPDLLEDDEVASGFFHTAAEADLVAAE